jgi:hypothetical protein
VAEPVVLPAMHAAQQQSWHALMEHYERVSYDWTLIGGQLVHLHCAERSVSPTRPTNDIDTVVDNLHTARNAPTDPPTDSGDAAPSGCPARVAPIHGRRSPRAESTRACARRPAWRRSWPLTGRWV